MTQGRSVTATFTVPQNLSVTKSGSGSGSVTSSPAGISCGSTCTHAFDYGTSVQLTATPLGGSSFDGWTGGGCSGTGSCNVLMTQARSVTATFTTQALVTLTVSKSGSGTVVGSRSGITCGTKCSHPYACGTSVTLTAKAALGSVFTGWSGACTGTSTTCHLSMTAARAATATFAVLKPLTVTKVGTGRGKVVSSPAGISCVANCTHKFAAGTVVILTATAKSGSSFIGWAGACSGTGNCVVTINAATKVKAKFALHAAVRRTASGKHARLSRGLEQLFGRLALLFYL